MTRLRYIATRTVQTVFLLWVVLTFLFFFFRLMPGDFTDVMLFQGVQPEQVEAFKEKWGLNDPIHIQYIRYMVNLMTLDAGVSLQTREPVFEFVRMKLFNSFVLIAPGITIGYILGTVLGTLLGYDRGSWRERAGVMGTVLIGSMPSFLFAIFMIMIFAIWLDLVPTSGMISPIEAGQFRDAPWWRLYFSEDFALHYVLPVATIALYYMNLPALIMRTSVVEVLNQDFIYYHRITGQSRIRRLRNIAKHASLPVITIYPISMTRAISGLVLIETVFNWPGMGFALVQAVLARDFPVVQFVFFLVAALVLIGNFGVDILYGIIDPRVSVDD